MKSMKSALAAAGLACTLLAPHAAHAALTTLSNLFVIGDSLSDGGNSGLVSGGFPPFPYANGRYSNGPTAVEQLWQIYNPGSTSFRPSLAGGTNYAIGGATSGTANYNTVNPSVPGLLQPAYDGFGAAGQLQQFQQYLAGGGTFDPATSLFVVWLFPNDVFAAAAGLPAGTVPGSPGGDNLVGNGIANILTIVGTLAALGAQHTSSCRTCRTSAARRPSPAASSPRSCLA